MTDSDTDEEPPEPEDSEEPGDPEDTPDEEGEDTPELGEEDYATLDEEMSADIVAADREGESEDGEETDETPDTTDSGEVAPADAPSIGRVYCNGLGAVATLAKDKHGSGVDDRERSIDEFSNLAQSCEIDRYMDAWAEEHMGDGEMSPGQGVVVMTAVFCVLVAVEDPELSDAALEFAEENA
jgi:hypothetical protein